MLSIKDIAKMAGVSRGTVDRVLNDRGSVNPEKSQRILDIINEVNFTPNRLGKRLAIRKKALKFGCVLYGYMDANPYFAEVVAAMRRKGLVLEEEYGIQLEIRHTRLSEPQQIIKHIDELCALGVNGFVISPIDDPSLTEKIAELKQQGIPVITIGSDLPNSERLAYVGSNSYLFGQTAANLLALFSHGAAQIGITMGSRSVLNHVKKVEGFQEFLYQHYPDMKIAEIITNNDDDTESYEKTREMLLKNPQIDSLYLAAGGLRGSCMAVQDMGLAGKLRIVSFDLMPFNKKMVEEGVILATIGQQPEIQAEKTLDILLDYLGLNLAPSRECFYTKTEIRIKANVTD